MTIIFPENGEGVRRELLFYSESWRKWGGDIEQIDLISLSLAGFFSSVNSYSNLVMPSSR
jgi:hypothetical protein